MALVEGLESGFACAACERVDTLGDGLTFAYSSASEGSKLGVEDYDLGARNEDPRLTAFPTRLNCFMKL